MEPQWTEPPPAGFVARMLSGFKLQALQLGRGDAVWNVLADRAF
jgi:hypothetical protein